MDTNTPETTQADNSFMEQVEQAYVRARQKAMPFWTYEDDTEAVGYLLSCLRTKDAELATTRTALTRAEEENKQLLSDDEGWAEKWKEVATRATNDNKRLIERNNAALNFCRAMTFGYSSHGPLQKVPVHQVLESIAQLVLKLTEDAPSCHQSCTTCKKGGVQS